MASVILGNHPAAWYRPWKPFCVLQSPEDEPIPRINEPTSGSDDNDSADDSDEGQSTDGRDKEEPGLTMKELIDDEAVDSDDGKSYEEDSNSGSGVAEYNARTNRLARLSPAW